MCAYERKIKKSRSAARGDRARKALRSDTDGVAANVQVFPGPPINGRY